MGLLWVHASNVGRFEQGCREITDMVKIEGWKNPKESLFRLAYGYLLKSA